MARSGSTRFPCSTTRDARRDRWVAATFGGLLLAGLLAGCSPDAAPEPSGTSAPTQPPASQEPTAAPTEPSPTPSSPSEPATPVSITCNDLLSLQAVYDFNPNYGGDPGYSPSAGSSAAEAVARQGTACGWLNQTSGDTFEVGVSQPSAAELERLTTDAAASGTPAQIAGADGAWFATRAGQGEVLAKVGPFWLVVAGEGFMSATDAEQLVSAAARALR